MQTLAKDGRSARPEGRAVRFSYLPIRSFWHTLPTRVTGTNEGPGARFILILLEMRDHLNRSHLLHDDGVAVLPDVDL